MPSSAFLENGIERQAVLPTVPDEFGIEVFFHGIADA
jgi:hypothetical protein